LEQGKENETMATSSSSSSASFSEPEPEAGFSFQKLLAPAGIALGAALFVLSRTSGGIASLEDLAQSSVPLDVALSNGRPSVVEFYADWCEVCKSLAKDSSVLKQRYGDRVNFVMLNVDNPKWAEEVAEYRVGGIPHWEYLDTEGNSKGFVVGNLPKEILDANAEALSSQAALPYVRKVFASSPLQDPQASGATERRDAQPRDHG
jgi:thiol-disulfide isomerase/thioredoxin